MTVRTRAGVVAALALMVACAGIAAGQTSSGGRQAIPGSAGVPGVGTEDARVGAPGPEEYAQSIAAKAPLSLPGPIDASLYRVGPGDVLQLLLWGKVSRAVTLEVGPEGQLLLPSAGTMSVHGRTLAEVRADVLRRMSREYRDVNMDLRLVRPRTFRVYLTGQVKAPGPIDASGAHRVADLLQPVMLLDDASRRRVEVIHADSTREVADLDRFFRIGTTQDNPYLRDGDVVNVPVAIDWVYAEGAVARPGRIELGPRDSLLTLFRLAGDPVPAADADRALLVRFTRPFQPESLWFALDDVYEARVNPVLRDGDRLYVYFIPRYHLQHQVSIYGEVARPGVYPISEGETNLSDLVTAAGGFLPGADLSAIRVNRRSPNQSDRDPELDRLLRLSRNELTNSEYEVLRSKLASLKEDFRVDWNRLQAHRGDLDVLLRDGDVVRVERLVSSIRVDGEVRRPGILAFRAGLGADDYIGQAGGFTDRAWKGRVRVTRAVTGQTLLARNVSTLDPGDIIWVPEKRDGNLSQGMQTFLLFAAQVATIVLAIDALND